MAEAQKIRNSCGGEAGHVHDYIKGEQGIIRAFWNTPAVPVGQKSAMCADLEDVPDGTEAKFSVWRMAADGKHEMVKDSITAKVEKGFVNAEWEYAEYGEDKEDTDPCDVYPAYLFKIDLDGMVAISGNALQHVGWRYKVEIDWDDNSPNAWDDEIGLEAVDKEGAVLYKSTQRLMEKAREIDDTHFEVTFHKVIPGLHYACYIDYKDGIAEQEISLERQVDKEVKEDSWDDVKDFEPYRTDMSDEEDEEDSEEAEAGQSEEPAAGLPENISLLMFDLELKVDQLEEDI